MVLRKGVGGLQWRQLYLMLSRLYQSRSFPSILIIHVGGNDLGRMRTLDLLFTIKNDLYRFKLTSPNTTIIFLKIVPRLSWLYSPKCRVMEKMRKWALEKYLLDGFSYRHVDLEGGIAGLYCQDRVHLSEVGLYIFNLGIQSCIEMASGLG